MLRTKLFPTQSLSLCCHVDIHRSPPHKSQTELLSPGGKGEYDPCEEKAATKSDNVILRLERWGNGIPEGWVDRSLHLVSRICLWASWSLCLHIWPFSDLEQSTRGLEFSVVGKSSMNWAWEELPRWKGFWSQFIMNYFFPKTWKTFSYSIRSDGLQVISSLCQERWRGFWLQLLLGSVFSWNGENLASCCCPTAPQNCFFSQNPLSG